MTSFPAKRSRRSAGVIAATRRRITASRFALPALTLILMLLLSACQNDEGEVALPTPQPIYNADSTQVLVAAGNVILGNVPTGWGNYTLPAGENPVFVDSFFLDRREVSNQQYAAYLNAATDSGWVVRALGDVWDADQEHVYLQTNSQDCRIDWVDSLDQFGVSIGYEQLPVVEVSWYGATAYAEFYGWRLPSEAEWEKAARGAQGVLGDTLGVGVGYPYPWGDAEPNADLANFGNPLGTVDEVDSHPQGMSWYGALNLAGNVWEWTSTAEGSTRVRRGGSYVSVADELLTAARFFTDPITTDRAIGFRCATEP